jgi:hypothetical protein
MRRDDLSQKLRDGHLSHQRPSLSHDWKFFSSNNFKNRDGGI